MNRTLAFIIFLVICVFILIFGIQYYQYSSDYHEAGSHAKAIGDMLSISFSAATGLGTLCVALYAVVNVKSWLAEKTNATGFKYAHNIIKNIRKLRSSEDKLHILLIRFDVVTHSFSWEDPERDKTTFEDVKRDLLDKIWRFDDQVNYLNIDIQSLPLWDVRVREEAMFNDFIKISFDLKAAYSNRLHYLLEIHRNKITHPLGDKYEKLRNEYLDSINKLEFCKQEFIERYQNMNISMSLLFKFQNLVKHK